MAKSPVENNTPNSKMEMVTPGAPLIYRGREIDLTQIDPKVCRKLFADDMEIAESMVNVNSK